VTPVMLNYAGDIVIGLHEHQSARMSNDSLTCSGTGCFIAVPTWQQWVSKS